MKKVLLLGAMAVLAMSANAQTKYTVEPQLEYVIKQKPTMVWGISDVNVPGADYLYIGPDNDTRNFWYWENTWETNTNEPINVEMGDGGVFASLTVGSVGWSGGGLAISDPGVDLSKMNEDTHFHIAYTTTGTAPAALCFILFNSTETGSIPAKVSVGKTEFEDAGKKCPLIGGEITDEWTGIDITLGDLKKLWPEFDLQNKSAWTGNVLSILSGNVTGSTFALDAVYFYNAGGAAVEGVEADATFAITANTVNVMGASGVAVYDMNGKVVASSNGTTVGISNLPAGVYVAKAGNAVAKFVK